MTEALHLPKGNRIRGSGPWPRLWDPPALVSSPYASWAPFEVGMAVSIPRRLRAQGGKGVSQVHRAGNGEVGSTP